MKKKDKFTFGKHKGKTLKSVMKSDILWVEWAVDNVEWLAVSEKVRGQIATNSNAERDRQERFREATAFTPQPKRTHAENLKRKRKMYAMASVLSHGFDYTNGS